MHEKETTDHRESTLVLYDLRDAAAWGQAGCDRQTWGRHRSEIHDLDNNHVVIEFRGSEALGGAA